MGRTDAVAFNLAVAAEARRLDPRLVIEYLPGWEKRGNGTSANYEGAIVHHTASNSSAANPFPTKNILLNGRPDLSGPLCNWAGPFCTVDAPRLVVVSAFPANHAGASGGRSMGPLPVTNLFNPRVLGLEIDYAGNSAMSAGQYRAATVWARAVTNVLARSTEYVRAHMETSITGKWDPGFAPGKTINMATFRKDAASITPGAPAPSPDLEEDEDMPLIVNHPKGIWALDGTGYHWIAETATVKSLQAAGCKSIVISEREHDNWVASQAAKTSAATVSLDAKPIADAVATAVSASLAGKTGISREDVRSAFAEVLLNGSKA